MVFHTSKTHKLKRFNILTTAAIPWFTGTSINPLYRAVVLSQMGYETQLNLPWLDSASQVALFGAILFNEPQTQINAIYSWLNNNVSDRKYQQLTFNFYPSYYSNGDIYSEDDLTAYLDANAINILEEPEHLFAYHTEEQCRAVKRYLTIGIIHTNYPYYQTFNNRSFMNLESLKKKISSRIDETCQHVIALNHNVSYGKYPVLAINGVSDICFPHLGLSQKKGMYFVGKPLWEKGFRSLIDLLSGTIHEIDIFGSTESGTDFNEIKSYAKKCNTFLKWRGKCTKISQLYPYKVFINTSLSEVLCTTTMEALAMDKFVILPTHESNHLFSSYKNSLFYTNHLSFKHCLNYTCENEPLHDKQVTKLKWKNRCKLLVTYIAKITDNELLTINCE